MKSKSHNNRKFSIQRIALLAILTALCHIGRLLLQPIPNVQPVTAILLIITVTMGTVDGMIVAALSILLSNLFMGMGPWTIYQIITYCCIILVTALFKKLYAYLNQYPRIQVFLFAGFGFLMGFLYGFIISIFSSQMFGINNFWVYYLQGVSFDAMHAGGNFIFLLLLQPILIPLINKQLRKYLM